MWWCGSWICSSCRVWTWKCDIKWLRDVCPFLFKKSVLEKDIAEKKPKKIKPTLCPSPSVTYQLISCFKHSTTLANAFRCIIALGKLETMCTVAIPAQRASLSSVNLRQQRASRTPPRVSTNRSERKPLWGFILPGSRRTRRTKTHWWHFSLSSWYSRRTGTASHRPLLNLFRQTSCLIELVIEPWWSSKKSK